MMKRLLSCILCTLLCLCYFTTAYAHPSAGEHWQDIRYVLFGDKHYRGKDQATVQKRQAIEYASQICIDQFSNSHSSMFVLLQDRVPRLKSLTLEAINLDEKVQNHRQHTHRGWNYAYSNTALNPQWADTVWPLRKEVMLATMEHVFNFNGLPNAFDPLIGYNEKCDAFCALVYYVHLLGDHLEFKASTYNRSNDGVLGKDQVIPLGGSHGDTLISELIKCFEVLFPEQDYSELVRDLDEVNSKIRTILNQPENLETEEGFAAYHNQANEVLEILHKHIPTLLKNEDFFSSVFY